MSNDTTKTCTKCGVEKLPIDFHRQTGGRDGLRACCRVCASREAAVYHANNREERAAYAREYHANNSEQIAARTREYRANNSKKIAARHREYHANNREERAAYHRKKKYGLSQEQYDALLAEHGGCCAICGDAFEDTPHIDHSHTSGAVRGLLCSPCNKGIGHLRDSLAICLSAAMYLIQTMDEEEIL